jgi:hypothetical protein
VVFLALWGNVHREISRANLSDGFGAAMHVFTLSFDYIALGILIACMLGASAVALARRN